MYNLNEVLQKCKRQLDAIGIRYGDVKEINVNNRFTQKWGATKYTDNGIYIQVSSILVDEINPKEALENTVMHELLHTCDGCDSHQGKWKQYADKVNQVYGYHIKRTNSAYDLGLVAKDNPQNIKHSFVCNCCGNVVNRQRESEFTKNYKEFRCAICGGTFSKLF